MSAVVSGIVTASFTGLSSSGAISITGLKVGDTVLTIIDTAVSVSAPLNDHFENVISVADEIQQGAYNHSGTPLTVVLYRNA